MDHKDLPELHDHSDLDPKPYQRPITEEEMIKGDRVVIGMLIIAAVCLAVLLSTLNS
ncbi:hypothetical protein [Pedobacter sp. SYP-B3415]|uniref:hypothetical protein n=1 Tax=Pedobacter sp. SYP-B3415 TaxID=2496641 RepID=UPI0013ED91FD|nr:hypothetical protein [Pedobacter sp. SYP-B3415]